MTHIVLARLQKDGRNTGYARVAGTESDDWALVQKRWDLLDTALRESRLYVVKDDPKWLYVLPVTNIAYLMVRDTKDPLVAAKRGPWATTWGDAARESIQLVVADNREAMHIGSLERRWGNAHGYHGHVGGWIYRNPCHAGEAPVTQGWWHVVPQKTIGHVLRQGGGYIMPVALP